MELLTEHRRGTAVKKGKAVGAKTMDAEKRAPEYKEADRTTPRDVMPAAEARQGVTGHNVRYVLSFGIAAVVVAFIIVYLVFFGTGHPIS
jgi:hypothetical protein